MLGMVAWLRSWGWLAGYVYGGEVHCRGYRVDCLVTDLGFVGWLVTGMGSEVSFGWLVTGIVGEAYGREIL